jgi:hypothetical protein
MNAAPRCDRSTAMPGTLLHTQNGFTQTTAEQHFREELGDERANASANDDPTTLKFEG